MLVFQFIKGIQTPEFTDWSEGKFLQYQTSKAKKIQKPKKKVVITNAINIQYTVNVQALAANQQESIGSVAFENHNGDSRHYDKLCCTFLTLLTVMTL